MAINIDVTHRIVINGREYASAEELPEDLRRAYEAAIAGNVVKAAAKAGHRVSVNGREYASVEAMPAEDRKLYELAIAAAREDASSGAAPGAGNSAGALRGSSAGTPARSSNGPSRWLVAIAVTALLYLLAKSLGAAGIDL